MANKIKLRRGNKSGMPTLDEGELAYVKDEQSVYVGTSSGNKELVGNGGGGTSYSTMTQNDIDNSDTTPKVITGKLIKDNLGDIEGALDAILGV